jgi:hypothetical protein
MKRLIVLAAVFVPMLVVGAKGDPTVAEVTHRQLQAVDVNGTSIYDTTDKVIIEGIILNNPEEMLDPTPGYTSNYQMWNMGGQWQMFIQGEADDHAGTALWMGQNYGNLPWLHNPALSYTDEEWVSELCRLNHDPCTGYTFAGDRVKVTGWYKFYGGKTNVNEQHSKVPGMDFEIELLDAAVGLPQPEVITLDDVKDANDDFIFDVNRLTGCEYYQARLVRINDVNFEDPNWGPDETGIIRNSTGRTFPVKYGLGPGFSGANNLTDQFDVIGILNQEDGSLPHTEGYEIWVTNYDGNGLVLADRGYKRGNLPSDINSDFKVDFKDFAEFAANWLACAPGLCDCN